MSGARRLTFDEAHALFQEDVRRAGGVQAWARKHGVALGYVSEARRKPEKLGPLLLNNVGVICRQITVYDLVRAPPWFDAETHAANPEERSCSGG